uniref:Ribonuclease H-like domain-containing protein n=1 Tax=Tanacetum cinerariifolium TaxID=118510 RepID=A0A699HYY5_TANCI|nr:ribonuclease H-like domain-containing protein [Tanacetum cinerariifolium]
MSVLKSHSGWKTKHFNGMSLEEIKEKVILVWNQIEDFVPMASKEEGERFKRKGLRLEQESPKKIKTSEEVSQEDLKEVMQLVPVEERNYWKIIRLGGSTTVYQFFIDMLKHFDREDLIQLWTLVKETLSIRQATNDKEKELWVELKRLFEPDVKDQLWTHTQALMHDPVEWRLYDSCGVHHVLTRDQEIFMLVEKDYPLRKGLAIVMISNKLHSNNNLVIQGSRSNLSGKIVVEGVTIDVPITTAKEKAQRILEVKARSTLMMGISNEHQLKFNSIKDAKNLLEDVEKRLEMLDQAFNRLQKLVSQLELLEEKLSQEDVNQKLLRSLSPEWNTHVVVWRNKAVLDTMSMDDLYKNLKDLEQIHPDDIDEMDLRWHMAMLTMRARRFLKKTRRKLSVNVNESIGFDKSNVKCYNCHKRGHFARECRAPRNQDNKHKKSSRRSVPMETSTSIALMSCRGRAKLCTHGFLIFKF